ncbi:nicotinate-nucleotide adenylyltransferase [Thalassotalea sp. HSM 43]|uniref:nicotinate-nucleotide adenylyltransferase n=1 Tax=Thalassotalea sp. HSM 43 TaxID=2552945 RepID=UPI001080CDF5|nr:nicotinate-nucleotide adenylyltransferase [Thalassotalea sp. HSM 43]QBY05494.1 nicotinate-nucleotide adenylyltransferase [Thalassotalea sp. HSM 43]
MMNQQRIGIFGGTFDPIHSGHIEPCKDLAKALNLSQVRLMPANIPPHKAVAHASSQQRLAMITLVCQHEPLFVCDDRELQRQQASYTLTSIIELRAENPDAQLFFFIGTDSLLNLHTWYRIDDILQHCHFVVSTRPGYDPSDISNSPLHDKIRDDVNQVLAKPSGLILLLTTCQIDISSTQIRHSIETDQQQNLPLPDYIARYIKENQLYQRPSSVN